MSPLSVGDEAVRAPNRYVETNGRRLAYRSIGSGTPLVLCMRFRGNLDLWDPLFLDSLAAEGFQVVTFDYSGLGLSTGTPDYNPLSLATDAHDLIRALSLRDVVVGGWSLGGLAAQAYLAMHHDELTHLVLIGTGPPGTLVKPAEQLFYDTASKAVNSLEDEVILFFEPERAASRAAAEQSHERIARRDTDLSPPVPVDFARAVLGTTPRNPIFPAEPVLEALRATRVPILHVGGDHDISFPIENWYALNRQLPTLQLLTYPAAGHAPHHQHPKAVAESIGTFVRTTGSFAREPRSG